MRFRKRRARDTYKNITKLSEARQHMPPLELKGRAALVRSLALAKNKTKSH